MATGDDVVYVTKPRRVAPRNSQPMAATKRRKSKSPVAAKNKWLRIKALLRNEAPRRIEALLRNKRFEARYRVAWERYQQGDRQVMFPYGTYKLRRLALVRVEPPPLAA